MLSRILNQTTVLFLMVIVIQISNSTHSSYAQTVRSRPVAKPEFSGKTINAIPISDQIELDGVLDEQIWQKAEPASGFLQSEPTEGQEASENTEVYMLYDKKICISVQICTTAILMV